MLAGSLVAVSIDERRVIEEFSSEEHDFAIQKFRVFRDSILGNHFHRKKHETFVFLCGGGALYLQPVVFRTDIPIAEGPVVARSVSAGSVVRIPAGMAHTFVLEAGTEFIGYSSTVFDPGDTIPFSINTNPHI